MGTTTFSGPVRAGTIHDTTGTTVGIDVANVGSVVMAQSEEITEAAAGTATSIVIPAGSQVINCTIFPTTVFAGTLTLGTTSTGQGFATIVAPADNARVVMGPVDNALWKDVGATDVRIYHDGASAGGGVGVLTVEYIQNNNLS